MNRKRPLESRQSWPAARERLFRIISIGVLEDWVSCGYDIISSLLLIANLTCSILATFEVMDLKYGRMFDTVEAVTVAFFAIDYVLRIITAKCLYPERSEAGATVRYAASFAGVVDLLSFLPYYLPVFFPAGLIVFRMFRVARIFRLFRINAYYDSLNVIAEVIIRKKQQLLSSVFIIVILMVASSLCMYSVEHEAQPDVFQNAFSGIWWSASTLLTVGYGDIYPVTTLGRVLGIIITFLGVGMVAIPTGIISAGFVEQYTRLKQIGDYGMEQEVRFIHVKVKKQDAWCGQKIRDLGLPAGMIIAIIQRGRETVIPVGEEVIRAGDKLILGAQSPEDAQPVELKEIVLKGSHPWNGAAIRDLDISRRTLIVVVRRQGTMLVPRGDLILMEGDTVVLYTRKMIRAEV